MSSELLYLQRALLSNKAGEEGCFNHWRGSRAVVFTFFIVSLVREKCYSDMIVLLAHI